MRPRRRSFRRPALVAALVLAVLVLGMWIGGRHSGWLPGPMRAALVGDADTAVVREAIEDVHREYYREIPRDVLADQAIEGLVSKLGDRFSSYFDPAEYRRVRQVQHSEFTGVGLSVGEDPRGLRVQAVFDGSPAKRAGIRPGDVVVEAAGRKLAGRSTREAVSFIKGPPGSQVRLTWIRDGRRQAEVLTRSTVTVPVVASRMARAGGCRTGVVRLAQFSSGAHAELYAALRRQEKRGARAFVLDLRGNGGGFVNEAQLVASAFLRDGPIVTTRGRAMPERTLRATGDPVMPRQPLVVLVDHGSASASEIVAGALQDRGRAKVVGTRTYGKGVFQDVIRLSNGGALEIVAGQYFTPKGRNLGGRNATPGTGISPDVKAEDDSATKPDEALDRALKVLAGACRE